MEIRLQLDVSGPGVFEQRGVLRRDLGIREHEDVVRVDVEAGHGEVRRSGQHLSGAAGVGDDEDLVVCVAAELSSLDLCRRLRCVEEELLELILGLRVLDGVVQSCVVEDHPDAALLRQLEQDLHQVGLVQVVREDVEAKRLVRQHLVQQVEDLLASREAEPLVLVGVRVLVAGGVGAGLLRRVEEELVSCRADERLQSEMVHERLRLHVSPCEPELELLRLERRNVDSDRHARARVERLQ